MAVLSLDRHLCFALYSASRAMTAAYRPVLTELNLTYPQYLVLLVLWEAVNTTDTTSATDTTGEGRVTVGQLGERLQLDSGTLSPLLKRLEANGFVRRERSRDDERLVEVTLTESGRTLEARAQCIPERLFASTGMTEGDAADLRDAVRRLADALTASPSAPDGRPSGSH
jgi:DNA-binding MarR family transcriptional regulator